MSADRGDVVESLDAATEDLLEALEHYHSASDQEDVVKAHLVGTLINLRIARRQALEIGEVAS